MDRYTCDQALGCYLRAWGHVETEFHNLFSDLLGAHISAARTIATSAIGAQALREITGMLGHQRLSSKDRSALDALLLRLRKATTIRNHIVHGVWRLSIIIGTGDKPNRASWERFYEPSDPDAMKELAKRHPNQKIASKHLFSVPTILKKAEEAASLAKDLQTFLKRASIGPFPDVLPVAFSAQ